MHSSTNEMHRVIAAANGPPTRRTDLMLIAVAAISGWVAALIGLLSIFV